MEYDLQHHCLIQLIMILLWLTLYDPNKTPPKPAKAYRDLDGAAESAFWK